MPLPLTARTEYPSWQSVPGSVSLAPGPNLDLIFSQVTGPGNTVATSIANASAGALPVGYFLIGGSVAYDIRTSAAYSGNLEICFTSRFYYGGECRFATGFTL